MLNSIQGQTISNVFPEKIIFLNHIEDPLERLRSLINKSVAWLGPEKTVDLLLTLFPQIRLTDDHSSSSSTGYSPDSETESESVSYQTPFQAFNRFSQLSPGEENMFAGF